MIAPVIQWKTASPLALWSSKWDRAISAFEGPESQKFTRAGSISKSGKKWYSEECSDLTLMSTDGMLQTAARVTDALPRRGVEARVLSMHTLKPLDIECVCLQPAARDLCLLSKSIIGGLRSAVAEVLAESNTSHVLFQRIGIPPVFSPHIETQDYMQRQHGLNPDSIVESVLKLLRTSDTWRVPLATAH